MGDEGTKLINTKQRFYSLPKQSFNDILELSG